MIYEKRGRWVYDSVEGVRRKFKTKAEAEEAAGILEPELLELDEIDLDSEED